MNYIAFKSKQIFNPYIIQQLLSRGIASKLIYKDYGEPTKVIQKEKDCVTEPKKNEVLVKMLAAPVNPVDINTIQGKYPLKPPLPAVPGNEGVGVVEKVGPDVTDIEEGDHVVPLAGNLGTWRTHLVLPSESLLKVPKDIGLIEAATLTVNPCTAYRMLKDFVALKSGDTIIQNGANSACGQNIIQMCKYWDITTINIIRNRPDLDEVKEFLTSLGADYVLTEEELRSTDIFEAKKVENPKLALNCVGGTSAKEIIRHLQIDSPLVTYGGMSRQPVTISTSALIFNNIQVRGFWISRWSNENRISEERDEMFKEILFMIENEYLQGPASELVKFDNYTEALTNTMTIKGMIGKKFILDFTSN